MSVISGRLRPARVFPGLNARRILAPAGRLAVRLSRPARPVLASAARVPLHIAGLACIDFAAFHLPHGWGWLVTGASLIWAEHVIADED